MNSPSGNIQDCLSDTPGGRHWVLLDRGGIYILMVDIL